MPENKAPLSSAANAGDPSPDLRHSESTSNLADTAAVAPQSQGSKSVPATWVGKSLGKYQVISVLGQGAMGVVLKAHDPTIERHVAIKVLAEHLAADATALGRFLAEAKAVGKVNHPNVMAIYEICQAGAIHYLVLEYVAGGSVEDRLTERNSLSVFEATQVLIDACKGVGAAHAVGLIHRDIKPANFMRTADGAVKVADFGLAKAAANSEPGLTQVGMIVGTPYFMSPEQCQAKSLDHRSDIYSLGATYYTLLTGKKPYQEAENVTQLMYLHCHGPNIDPRSVNATVPESCSQIVARAMAKAPAERYQFATEMLADLQAVAATLTGDMPARTSMAEAHTAPTLSSRAEPLVPSSSRQRTQTAERRQVTVLVCGGNLFESEAYLEGLDAEDQLKVQHAFKNECAQAVYRFGGAVVQCNEQGLLACFGYPVAYEDAAPRAANAGLDMLNGMNALGDRLRREHNLELSPWAGLHTGLAVVEANEDAISLVGEARNVAVRLEDLAAPGQLICSESTHRLLRDQFQSISIGHKKIKGVSQPIEFFRVYGVGVARSSVDAAGSARLTPLTGRDNEISLLKDRWEQAREGMGQVVLLVGEAGLGKSRLVHALKEHVQEQIGDDTDEDAPVIEWRCAPHYQNTGLYPAIDFYERALGFGPAEPAQSRFDRMLHRLERYDLARPETVPLWASLLSLLTPARFPPLSMAPARQREETFRVIREWLHVRASVKPTLFIIEDLHWVDASTLEFLGQFLAEGLHDQMLTVLTFRPEFQTPWPALAHQTSLALTHLTRRQVGDLMRKKAGADLPDALIEKIYDRAGGVPLFVEEFTKMMQESEMLGEAGTGAQPLPTREIPSTLQDLVMARLDRTESNRELAQLAAVLGREFSYELLSAVATVGEPALQAELAKLVQAEILYQKGRPPGCTYLFKHALLEDALYNALVKGKRQQFHRRIAEVLETRFLQTVETRPELLAHHFAEAGLPEKAIVYWLKSGLRSRARSAEIEAISHLTRGLTLLKALDESPERDARELELLGPLGTAYIASRGYAAPEVEPAFRRARELCGRVGQPHQLFALMLGIWEWHTVRGDLRVCMELAAEGMEFAVRLNDPGIMMEALFMSGETMLYRGDFACARDRFATAVAEYDDRERTKSWAVYTSHNAGVTCRSNLAIALWHLGYPEQALKINREMRQLAREIGHPYSLAYGLHHTGWLYLYCRLGAEIQTVAEEEIAIATQQRFTLWLATGTFYRGGGMLLRGEAEKALPMFLKGIEAFRASGAELTLPFQLGILGEAYTQAHQFANAHCVLDEGLAIAQKTDERCQEAELQRLKGELLLAESPDQTVAAEACFRHSVETAQRQQSRAWELRATMSLARLWQRQARREEARAALAAVYATYTEGFAMPDLVDALTLLKKLA